MNRAEEQRIIRAAARVVALEDAVFVPAHIDQPSAPAPAYAALTDARAELRAAVRAARPTSSGGHGAQGDPATAHDRAHETADRTATYYRAPWELG